MVPTTRGARRAFAKLPTDVLSDVLLLLSAKELCRLRVVCRAWRSLTSDPHFIRAHAARHHQREDPPLFVASFFSDADSEERMVIDLIDPSGKTVKRVAGAMDGGGQVLCPRLGLVLVASKSGNTCRVLDAAAAADAAAGAPVVAPRFRLLPVPPAPSHRGPGSRRRLRDAATLFAFGKVAATGEHKVLRIFHRLKEDDRPHLFEVLTLAGRRRRGRERWRDMPSPDMFVCPDSNVVVDGVVYFLRNDAVYKKMAAGGGIVPPADCVASFDLDKEEWRKRLQGPMSMGYTAYDDNKLHDDLKHHWCHFASAELKGSLVLVQYLSMTHLWILTDIERGVWVKQYDIRFSSIEPPHFHRLKPLFVLDDGRLVMLRQRHGSELGVYDPRTDEWEWPEPGPLRLGAIGGIYTGSLLGLQDAW